MGQVQVWHNSRCSKSRATLQWLDQKKIDYEIFEYLHEALNFDILHCLLKNLNLSAHDIVRRKEAFLAQQNLKIDQMSEKEVIQLLIQEPTLIERPIVRWNEAAVIARPPEETLLRFFDKFF